MRTIFIDGAKCLGCKSCELACCAAHSTSGTITGAFLGGEELQTRVHVEPSGVGAFPIQCRHCEDALCVKACVTGAMERGVDGTVVYDAKKCLGCAMCVIACPFGVCETLKKAVKTEDSVNAVSKCDLCAGRGAGPACVEGCPTGALCYEEAKDFARDKRRAYLVNIKEE